MALVDGDVLISFNWDTTAERIASGPGGLGNRLGLPVPRALQEQRQPGEAARLAVVGGRRGFRPYEVAQRARRTTTGGDAGRARSPAFGGVHAAARARCRPHEGEADQRNAAGEPSGVRNLRGPVGRRGRRDHGRNILVGYRFPSEDGYGRFLLREAARRRGRPLPPVPYYALKGDRVEIEKALQDVFGPDVESSFRGPATPATPKH